MGLYDPPPDLELSVDPDEELEVAPDTEPDDDEADELAPEVT